MDKLDALHASYTTCGSKKKRAVHPAVSAALKRGQAVLNKYYEKTDLSNIYRIAMSMFSCFFLPFKLILTMASVLHPGLKLQYFSEHKWPKAWITTAKDLAVDEFKKYIEFEEMSRREVEEADVRVSSSDTLQNI